MSEVIIAVVTAPHFLALLYQSREKTDTDRRYHRQPVREDGAKRGMRGFDGGKLIKGRKRHVAVDTLGLLLCAIAHSAGISDSRGGRTVMLYLTPIISTILVVFVDGGYKKSCLDIGRMPCSALPSGPLNAPIRASKSCPSAGLSNASSRGRPSTVCMPAMIIITRAVPKLPFTLLLSSACFRFWPNR
jgi:hypothetical protein